MSNQDASETEPAILTVCSSWSDVREGLEPGEVLYVGKDVLPHPKDVGMKLAANTIRGWLVRDVFCDHRRRNSLRVYDYGDHYKVKVVKHNPDEGIVAAASHAVSDAPTHTALALSLGYSAYQAFKSDVQR